MSFPPSTTHYILTQVSSDLPKAAFQPKKNRQTWIGITINQKTVSKVPVIPGNFEIQTLCKSIIKEVFVILVTFQTIMHKMELRTNQPAFFGNEIILKPFSCASINFQ